MSEQNVGAHDGDLSARVIAILQDKFGDGIDAYAFPPPVFVTMEAEIVELDLDGGVLAVQFPVRARYLNPYGMMQGGMVAAAVDNTLGPLSVLVAPPNVTRRLEMTYSRPVTPELGYIIVRAWLVGREAHWLTFRAEVRSRDGQRLARAKAVHWIVGREEYEGGGAP
jgi:acyl-coenzyme A thioesterase PaaI-like protein